jgi:tetratricopeptide (TPR) repeat protein
MRKGKPAKIWEEQVIIPTYGVGKPDKNPMFLEKRVYQGSSGKVYPYPVIDKIFDTKEDKPYQVVFLENEFLKVMILPELGGRIQRAYDKTNGYDFVYHNEVIKPALVGLLGPWISGGIEFNWPQHHRPTTFMPVDYQLRRRDDGSVTLLVGDLDEMYGTKVVTMFTLHPGNAYIEITSHLYNRTSMPQTFLWWANPAVAVNNDTQSVFPPDVNAVYDHGKRDVSRFPIARGIYYKHDYSEGVDISRYKNIPVPTSYMAYKSSYDFVGGYDYAKEAGILHVADHHISPGKKQWTWGCEEFGKAWDRNLTDANGPYIELMTGVFTDNQPDFSWLQPFEEKSFTQYFMPYKKAGYVKNASTKVVLNFTLQKGKVALCVYPVCDLDNITIVLSANKQEIFREAADLKATVVYEKEVEYQGKEEDLQLSVCDMETRKVLLSARAGKESLMKLPDPAPAAKQPEDIRTVEELYLTAQHIEQYRHATYESDPYYVEGLKRDEGDSRINNGYGMLLLRRADLDGAETHFRKALKRLTELTPNPYDSEPYFNLGVCLVYEEKYDEAFDAFFKATWSEGECERSWYYLAALSMRKGEYETALEYVNRSLSFNTHNIKALDLQAWALVKMGHKEEAVALVKSMLDYDPFDLVSRYLLVSLNLDSRDDMRTLSHDRIASFRYAAADLRLWGCFEEAIGLLSLCGKQQAMLYYDMALCFAGMKSDHEKDMMLEKGSCAEPSYVFPNTLDDDFVLRFVLRERPDDGYASYYLGNLRYADKRYQEARELWEKASALIGGFPTVWRNLALVYFNKYGEKEKAIAALEKAFSLDETDARVFLELDQLREKLNVPLAVRLEALKTHWNLVECRDDLFISYVSLLNMSEAYQQALSLLESRKFHPWEGGEGKVSSQYIVALKMLALQKMEKGEWNDAVPLLKKALVYPDTFGEGKLEGKKDNDIHYFLGVCKRQIGQEKQAENEFSLALLGNEELAGAMYYYDQPADVIFYQALSLKQLGRQKEAAAKLNKLVDFGENHLFDNVKIDYFAVSLPDLQLWNDDLTLKNQAHCWFLMAMGRMGRGDVLGCKSCIQKALSLNPWLQSAMNLNRLIPFLSKG